MRRRSAALATGFLLFAAGVQGAGTGIEIWSPGFAPTKVGEGGAIAEPWGTVRLQLQSPAGAKAEPTRAEGLPMPAAVTRTAAGAVLVTQTAYRAPIWPAGADVLDVIVRNGGKEPAQASVELALPEGISLGEHAAAGRKGSVLLLPPEPAPVREEREWGCLGGVTSLPGWAKPETGCDPAFRSIAAGMGGLPIRYRFAMGKGEKRRVALGFCESHHPGPGNRIMDVSVEGAPVLTVDPNQKWGRHRPGVLQFAAADADQDGRINVCVSPHPGTPDHNPILNAIWVFKDPAAVDEAALIRGGLNATAERFADVGGEADQLLYKDDRLRYVLDLAPGQERRLWFLLRNQDGSVLPDPGTSTWTPERLRQAAADVWAANAGLR